MPSQRGNVGGGLLQKLGDRLRQAHEAHKTDETEYRASNNLPPGIEEGIAQLEDCEFQIIKEGKKNAGEYQLYASGIVLEPIEHTYEDPPKSGKHRTMKTQGLRTFIVEPLCDTSDTKPNSKRKTLDDHLAWIYNELRKLGYDTANMEIEDLEGAVEALREAKPIFKFRTWRGQPSEQFPNPLTNHDWLGLVDEDYVPPDSSEDNDQTAAPPKAQASVNGKSPPPTPAKPSQKSPTKAPVDNTPPEDLEFGDIDSLVTLASNKKATPQVLDARGKLTQMAIAAGYTEQQVDEEAEDWAMVADWIRGGSEEEEGDEDEESEEAEESENQESEESEEEEEASLPVVGEVWKTRLPDPKNPKVKSKKLTQVEVVKVYKNSTCDVKNLTDKKVYKGITFQEMLPAD